jgi:hypothetical protein
VLRVSQGELARRGDTQGGGEGDGDQLDHRQGGSSR